MKKLFFILLTVCMSIGAYSQGESSTFQVNVNVSGAGFVADDAYVKVTFWFHKDNIPPIPSEWTETFTMQYTGSGTYTFNSNTEIGDATWTAYRITGENGLSCIYTLQNVGNNTYTVTRNMTWGMCSND
ncbi:MAG: hypothetical protein KKF98_16600 [Bacteroidetes bacterium]|nr:hypothetical protein [Bacteroidota bacterium]